MMPENPGDARWPEDAPADESSSRVHPLTDLESSPFDLPPSRSTSAATNTSTSADTPVLPPPATQQSKKVEVQRIDNPRSTEVAFQNHPTAARPMPSLATQSSQSKSSQTKPSTTSSPRRPDPILQSLMLLVTMACMLAAARYAVPSIVEEIRFAWHRGELRAEYETGTDGLKNVSLDTLSQAYQMVTSVVGPSVVHIEVERRASGQNQSAVGSLLSPRMLPSADQGSGAIVDEAGFILTNRHVIADGEDITVTLSDGREVPATIVGTDALTDLAVLKVDATGLIPIKWGDSDRCRVGSPVWAIGSPFGFDRSVTFGILSGKHRMVRASTRYQDFMQSDVAVNPGNSGGPLVDAGGTLIGINTAIVGDTYQGVSFSIPSSVAKKVYEQLISTGRVDRGWLGVSLAEVPDELFIGDNHRVRGAFVGGLADRRSPAAIAGVIAGDIITEVDGVQIRDMGHLMRIIGNAIAGTDVELTIRRPISDKETSTEKLRVRLNARPADLVR